VGARIEPQVAYLDRCRPFARRASHDRPQARQQLGERERFRQVVVGAGVEPADAVADRIPRGQHQHRDPDLALTEAFQDREAVEAREHHVEQNRVVGGGLDHPERVFADSSDVSGMAFLTQPSGDQSCHFWFVLDDEHAHGGHCRHASAVSQAALIRPSSTVGELQRLWISISRVGPRGRGSCATASTETLG